MEIEKDTPQAAADRLRKLIEEVAQEQTAAKHQASKRAGRWWWLALAALIACAGALYALYHFGLLRLE